LTLPIINRSSIPKYLDNWYILDWLDLVVIYVNNARFLTKPHDSPSGVSVGHIIPQWLPYNALGPDIFIVFSIWLLILVIMPNAPIYVNLLNTWVTPYLSILNLLILQFPLLIALLIPLVIRSFPLMKLLTSTIYDLLFFNNILSIYFFNSLLNTFSLSSNSNDNNYPAHSSLLFP